MPTVASIFSGCGGTEVGAMKVGYTPIWAIEIEPRYAAVHRANIPGQLIQASVLDVDPRRLVAPDLLCISPPCQAHSKARRHQESVRCDENIGLVAIHFALALRPSRILLENVPEYSQHQVFGRIVESLHRIGYGIDYNILDAAEHGVGSIRTRLIMRACLGRAPGSTSWPSRQRPITWKQAITGLHLPEAPGLAPWQAEALRVMPPNKYPVLISGGNPSFYWQEEDGERLKIRRAWTAPDMPAPAIVKAKSMSGTRVLHANGRVEWFTPRAAARCMGFPDSFRLPESSGDAFDVIGNAVPPPLAAAVLAAWRC